MTNAREYVVNGHFLGQLLVIGMTLPNPNYIVCRRNDAGKYEGVAVAVYTFMSYQDVARHLAELYSKGYTLFYPRETLGYEVDFKTLEENIIRGC